MVTSNEEKLTHRQHAVANFNGVWDLLENNARTSLEEEEMIHKAHASLYHWTKVKEHTATNISVGYWQLARVYAEVNVGERALHYAEKCLDISVSNKLDPFYIAYGHEAKARAYKVLKNDLGVKEQVLKCKEEQAKIENKEYSDLIDKDLHTL